MLSLSESRDIVVVVNPKVFRDPSVACICVVDANTSTSRP